MKRMFKKRLNPDVPGGEYIRADVKALADCSAIALLPGWERSTGARCEAVVARTIGLSFYCAETAAETDPPARIICNGGYEQPAGAAVDVLDTQAERVVREVRRAMQKFPTWPRDPFHALAVASEEHGELAQALLQYTYEPSKGVTRDDVRNEAVQFAAMGLRFLLSVDRYLYTGSIQHEQQLEAP